MEDKDYIIEMHDTWLVIDAIRGCTNGCKYCFLQERKENVKKPEILVSPEEAIHLLFSSRYYDPYVPINLLPGTDAFLTEETSHYTYTLLQLLEEKKVKNPITIVTKCLIPTFVLEKIEELTKKGMTIVIYISYSGLGKTYEPNIKEENIIRNFQELKKRNIKMIHYYRPFFKENANINQIKEILSFVKQYTPISVVTGFKVKPEYLDQVEELCQSSSLDKELIKHSTSLWPKEAYDYFFSENDLGQQVYQTNYCALASLLKKESSPFFATYECKTINRCSEEQKKRCMLHGENNKDNFEKTIISLLKHIDKYDKEIKIRQEENSIIISNSMLTIGDVAYLTFRLGKKVTLDIRNDLDRRGASSLSNGRPYLY